MKIYATREDYIDKSVRDYRIKFKDLDPFSIGELLKKEGIHLDKITLDKRIEKIQNEIEGSSK